MEKTYVDYLGAIRDDSKEIQNLHDALHGKDILMLLPGSSIKTQKDLIDAYCKDKQPVVISVNLISADYPINYAYFSNKKRYDYWKNASRFSQYKKIVTSNIINEAGDNEFIVDFTRLVKSGWEQLDNSGVLLLRLLDCLDVNSIIMAGFDGYSQGSGENYAQKIMEKARNIANADEANRNVSSLLEDYKNTRTSTCPISFLTPSRFESIFERNDYESR